MNTTSKQTKIVHEFLETAKMKFKPEKTNFNTSNSVLTKLQTIIGSRSNLHGSNSQGQKQLKRLVYLERIGPQFFLIGNQYQLDLINIGKQTKNYIDTQFCWSLSTDKLIQKLCVDSKKCLIVILSGKQISIYKYDLKKLHSPPFLYHKIFVKEVANFTQFLKESLLGCFFNDHVEIYAINDEGIKKKYQKKYGIQSNMTIYQVPPPFEQTMNIFFVQDKPGLNLFSLWYVELHITSMDIRMEQLQKIYDIKNSLKKDLKIDNYSKEIFLMNLGSEILAVKRGYVIDNVNVNIKNLNSVLKYLGNEKLLHLTDKKVQVYNFKIDRLVTPQKICLKPLDSIILKRPSGSNYFGAIELSNDNFAVIYQQKQTENKRSGGQLLYYIAQTLPITIQSKINSIFKNIDQIKTNETYRFEKCDMAYKMGLTTKEIFLELWNRSNRQSDEDYALLLATQDYQTIKLEVQKKLKKQSMSFKEVMKIEQSCFEMLSERVFGVYCNEQNVIEYISCHFFKRKLELFKDLYLCQHSEQRKQRMESPDKLVRTSSNRSFSQKSKKGTTQLPHYGPNTVMISIQQYNKYKRMDIKAYLLQLISMFCFQNKNTIRMIRIILTSFKFMFRMIYEELLDEIIQISKNQLPKLLTKIPQLIPYKHKNDHFDESYLYEGVWSDITPDEWKQSLYESQISTVDNISMMQQFVNSVWFKRNWLIKHDLIKKNKQQIIKHYQKIKSGYIFNYFIAKLFQHHPFDIVETPQLEVTNNDNCMNLFNFNLFSSENKTQQLGTVLVNNNSMKGSPLLFNLLKRFDPQKSNKELISCVVELLERQYEQLSQHLKNRIFLYNNIFKVLTIKKILPQNNNSFCQFLYLQNPELYQHFFKKQRNHKGLLLKDIKSIYQKVKGIGIIMFNEGLLQYFQSNKSQVSDLKYILNRINNQKKQFHDANKEMYRILVKAMLMKLKVGSDNDIPIDQVLIYIESIPLQQQKLRKQIQFIQQIRVQSQYFKKMKLNMSLEEMMNEYEQVIKKMVIYQMQVNDVNEVNSKQIVKFRQKTKTIISNVNNRKFKLYEDKGFYLVFYEYICNLMEKIEKINLCGVLLNDYQYCSKYAIDDEGRDQVVYFMYKLRFSKYNEYTQNQKYILELKEVLNANKWKLFLENQMELAIILSNQTYQVQYPLSKNGAPSIQEIKQIISNLPSNHVLSLNLYKIYQLISQMEDIVQNHHIPLEINSSIKNRYVTLQEIYQVIILRLIELNELKKLPPIIKQLLLLNSDIQHYNIVYPILLIESIINLNQLNIDCRQLLSQCILYYFNDAIGLLQLTQQILTMHFTNDERKKYLLNKIQTRKTMYNGYEKHNPLFGDLFNNYLDDEMQKIQQILDYVGNKKFDNQINRIINIAMGHLQKSRQIFKKQILYKIIIYFLVNQPFILGKYLELKLPTLKLHSIRLFFSYLSMEIIFDNIKLLQFCNRIFIAISEVSPTSCICLEKALDKIKEFSLTNTSIQPQHTSSQTQNLDVAKTAEIFRKKKAFLVKKKQQNMNYQGQYNNEYLHIFQNKRNYQFEDSDNDEYEDEGRYQKKQKKIKVVKEFNWKTEMKNMVKKRERVVTRDVNAESQELKKSFIENKSKIALTSSVRAPYPGQFHKHQFNNRKDTSIFDMLLNTNSKLQKKNINVENNLLTIAETYNQKQQIKLDGECNSIVISEGSSIIKQQNSGLSIHNENLMNNKQKKTKSYQRNNSLRNEHQNQLNIFQMQQQRLMFSFNNNQFKKNLKITQKQSEIIHEEEKKSSEKDSEMNNNNDIELVSEVHELKINPLEQKMELNSFNLNNNPNINNSNDNIITFTIPSQQKYVETQLCFPPNMFQCKLSMNGSRRLSQYQVDSIQNSGLILRQHSNDHIVYNSGCKDKSQSLIDELTQQLIKDNEKYICQNEGEAINLAALKQLGQQEHFNEVSREIIRQIYENESLILYKVIKLILEIAKQFPSIGIKSEWVEIYLKAQSIHQKYSLDLPLRQIFPIVGIYFQQQSSQKLYEYIRPHIISVLNDMNVYKTVKVVSLAFKTTKIEQDILYEYLKGLVEKYLRGYNEITQNSKQKDMENQVISVMIGKIKPQILSEKIQDLFEEMPCGDKKNELIDFVSESIIKRSKMDKEEIKIRAKKVKNH